MDQLSDDQMLYTACGQAGTLAQVDAYTVLWDYLYRVAYGILRDQGDAAALAADCAQIGLVKIHENLARCHNPQVFRNWAAQIVRRVVLNELRRPERRRMIGLPSDEDEQHALAMPVGPDTSDLRTLLTAAVRHGPLSDRSRRVVWGRYFAEQEDDELARIESELSGRTVLPSHIQVTRAKNLSSLRRDAALLAQLRDLIDP